VRVLLADNDQVTRHGISLVLVEAGLAVCAEADDADSAIERALQELPGVCLVSLELPGGGLRAAAQIRSELPDTAVIMLADAVGDQQLFDALRVGSSGFLLKGMNPARLPHVLHGVLRGEAALPRELVARVAEEFRDRSRRRHLSLPEARGVDLTNREWEVIELLGQGLSTRDISFRLRISQITVRRHIGTVVKKLHVESRAAALELLKPRSHS